MTVGSAPLASEINRVVTGPKIISTLVPVRWNSPTDGGESFGERTKVLVGLAPREEVPSGNQNSPTKVAQPLVSATELMRRFFQERHSAGSRESDE